LANGIRSAARPGDKILAAIKKDLEILRQFNRRADRLERSGLGKRYESEIPNVIAKIKDVTFERGDGARSSIVARIHPWIEDFRQDEIDAFVLSYRVFTQPDDRLSIPSLAKICEKDWMSEPPVNVLKMRGVKIESTNEFRKVFSLRPGWLSEWNPTPSLSH
jgi:hypothetical protein